MSFANLSDEELLSSLSAVCFEARRLLGRLLLHLIEVEQRRLDLKSACSSLYDFCQRRLGMSESEAIRRIEAARLLKRKPSTSDVLNVATADARRSALWSDLRSRRQERRAVRGKRGVVADVDVRISGEDPIG
jgi:hypothetical protein